MKNGANPLHTKAPVMDDRPFYELDDEELIIAEATQTALSSPTFDKTALPVASAQPGVVLCANIDEALLERLDAHAQQTPLFTLLDHAQILNAFMCTLGRSGDDRFGLAALVRHENGLIQLDRVAPSDLPRSMNNLRPEDAISRLTSAAPTDRGAAPNGFGRRMSSTELLSLAPLADEPNRFLTMRRLGLALVPNLTSRDITADAFKDYAFTLRIFVNAIAARWTLLPWSELRRYTADDADAAARAVIKALRHEFR